MIVAILILIMIFVIAGLNVRVYVKSKSDTIKVSMKIAFVYFVVPHQYIIDNFFSNEVDGKNKFKKIYKNKGIFKNVCKHSTLVTLYISKFTMDEITKNPYINGSYHIFTNLVKGIASSIFKRIDQSIINLIYNPKYENIDYYFELKTDVISIAKALIDTKLKG